MEIVSVGRRAPAVDSYVWGRSTWLRLCREYTGLPQELFAEGLARVSGRTMALRSYQRMELGDAAIHESMWSSVAALLDRFDNDVRVCVEEVNQELRDAGVDPDKPEDHQVVVMVSSVNMWQRCVMARAMRAQPALVPITRDDKRALEET